MRRGLRHRAKHGIAAWGGASQACEHACQDDRGPAHALRDDNTRCPSEGMTTPDQVDTLQGHLSAVLLNASFSDSRLSSSGDA